MILKSGWDLSHSCPVVPMPMTLKLGASHTDFLFYFYLFYLLHSLNNTTINQYKKSHTDG